MANNNPLGLIVQIPQRGLRQFELPSYPGQRYELHVVNLDNQTHNDAIIQWRLHVFDIICEQGELDPRLIWELHENEPLIDIENVYDWNYRIEDAPRVGDNFLQDICRLFLQEQLTQQDALIAIIANRPFAEQELQIEALDEDIQLNNFRL